MGIKNSFILSLFLLTIVIAFQNCGDGGFKPLGTGQDVNTLAVVAGSCTFNGQNVLNGANVTAYLSSTGSTASPCAPQTRTCNNSILSGTYEYATCGTGAAACLFNGTTVASGASVTGYTTATVPYGQTCTSESLVCTDGSLSGGTAFATCTVNPPDLTGTWVQACRASSGYSVQDTNVFTATGFQTVAKFFGDTTCTSLLATANASGTNVIGAPVPSIGTGVDKINFIAATETITPASALAAFYLNAQAVCGLTNWATGTAQNVMGLTCSVNGTQISGSSINTLIQITGGNSMLLGAQTAPGTSTDGSSDANRPTSLDTVPFIKQ